jgi:hypothetical protein
MLFDDRNLKSPIHIPPRLHKDALWMSYENHFKLRKIYNEIIGLNNVHHFSINIVDHYGEMSIISYSPHIIHNIFSDGTYLYNGSISPTYYETLDFYTWDQCYDKRFYNQTKVSLEIKNGIQEGIVIVHKECGFHVLFSFATKRKNYSFVDDMISYQKQYIKMGFHCFELIKDIYSEYYTCNDIYNIKRPDKFKPVCGKPNLKLIK